MLAAHPAVQPGALSLLLSAAAAAATAPPPPAVPPITLCCLFITNLDDRPSFDKCPFP